MSCIHYLLYLVVFVCLKINKLHTNCNILDVIMEVEDIKTVLNKQSNTKNKVVDGHQYLDDCSSSDTWSMCKVFTDENNKSTILATPRNSYEKVASWEKS